MSPQRVDMDNKWHHLFSVLQPGPEDLMWPGSQSWGISGENALASDHCPRRKEPVADLRVCSHQQQKEPSEAACTSTLT